MRETKTCPYCKVEFKPERNNQIYCSRKHGWDYRNEKKEKIWENETIKRIKSNDDLLKAVFENPRTNGVCSWNYLLSLGFYGNYFTHQATVSLFKYNVMLKYGYLKEGNGNTTIKKIYE